MGIMMVMNYFVYVLKCADGTFYTGYTTDLKRREAEHNGKGGKAAKAAGARYTRRRRPVKIIYYEKLASRSEALKREAAIKRLSRQEKEKLTGVDRF